VIVFAAFNGFTYIAVRVIKIAKIATPANTKLHTSRNLAFNQTMYAKSTLAHSLAFVEWSIRIPYRKIQIILGLLRVELTNIVVRTGLDTLPAAGTFFVILYYDAVFLAFISRSHRADLYTGRVLTVLAVKRQILHVIIGKSACCSIQLFATGS
jgi:hypothetical protein